MSLVRADGAIRVPAPEEGVARWRDVEVLLHGGDINL